MYLTELLDRQGISYSLEEHPQASTAIGLAIAVDVAALRSALGAKHLRLISEDELSDICLDCELGAEPPVGRLFGMDTLMDESLLDEDAVIFQAGTHHTAVRMSLDEFRRITDARVINFTR